MRCRFHLHAMTFQGVIWTTVVCVLGTHTAASAQTAVQDVQQALCGALDQVNDLFLVLDSDLGSGKSQRLELTLTGKPAWVHWKYHIVERGVGRYLESVSSFDGQRHFRLQSDGMGALISKPLSRNPEYLSFSGVFLSNLGLAPETGAAMDNWRDAFRAQEFTLSDDDTRRGVVVMRHKNGLVRELDSRFGFMPIRAWQFDSQGTTIADIRLHNYEQIGGIWIPRAVVVEKPNHMRVDVKSAQVNRGRSSADVQIEFPYGTNLLLDNDQSRCFGEASLEEAELGLQNWWAYRGKFGRSIRHKIETSKDSAKLAPDLETRVHSSPPLTVAILLAAAVFSFASVTKCRVVTWVVLAVCLSVGGAAHKAGAADDSNSIVNPSQDRRVRSLSACLYIFLDMCDRPTALSTLDASVSGSSDFWATAVNTLSENGIEAQTAEITVAWLQASRQPAIVELKPRRSFPYPRFAVVVDSVDDNFTLIDPHPFGELAAWSREKLTAQLSGKGVILASARPAASPVSFMWLWWLLVLLAVLVWVLRRVPKRTPTGLPPTVAGCSLLAVLLCLPGCGEAKPVNERRAQDAKNCIRIEPALWTLNDVYPDDYTKKILVKNDCNTAIKLLEAQLSCGCIASGIPTGEEFRPQSSTEFAMSISLKNSRGTVAHTATFKFADGSNQTLRINALVKRGLIAKPELLAIESKVPGTPATGEIVLESDDGSKFQIVEAELVPPEIGTVSVRGNSVIASLPNRNREPFAGGSIHVRTDHPRVETIVIPLTATYARSWEADPTSFFVHDGTSTVIKREVTIRSTQNVPFTIASSAFDDVSIAPHSETPAVRQTASIQLPKPAVIGAPKRVVVELETTLQDAGRIPIAFTFYQ